jgi:Flp pilus assembly pilin Flp
MCSLRKKAYDKYRLLFVKERWSMRKEIEFFVQEDRKQGAIEYGFVLGLVIVSFIGLLVGFRFEIIHAIMG